MGDRYHAMTTECACGCSARIEVECIVDLVMIDVFDNYTTWRDRIYWAYQILRYGYLGSGIILEAADWQTITADPALSVDIPQGETVTKG